MTLFLRACLLDIGHPLYSPSRSKSIVFIYVFIIVLYTWLYNYNCTKNLKTINEEDCFRFITIFKEISSIYDPVFNKKVTKVSERNKAFEDTCPPGPPPPGLTQPQSKTIRSH